MIELEIILNNINQINNRISSSSSSSSITIITIILIIQDLLQSSWRNPSLNSFHWRRSSARGSHAGPRQWLRSSPQRVYGRPLFLGHCLGAQSVVSSVYLLSLSHEMCPAHLYLFILISHITATLIVRVAIQRCWNACNVSVNSSLFKEGAKK